MTNSPSMVSITSLYLSCTEIGKDRAKVFEVDSGSKTSTRPSSWICWHPGEHRLHGHTAPKLSVSVGSMATDACRDIVEGVQAFGQNLVKKRHKQVPSEAEYTRH